MTAVLGLIDILLQMFDAHTHRKGFCLHGDTQSLQMTEGISCAVANGKDHMVAGNGFFSVDLQAGNCAVFLVQVRDLGMEADFTAQGNDPLADVLHHRQQHIRTHMRLGIKENILSCSRFYKLFQHPADAGIVDTGVQLAVRERTGAAFAKLDIAFGVQFSGFEEMLHLFMAGSRIFTTLQNNGTKSINRQNQGRKHTRRAKTHNHRTVLRQSLRLGNFIIGHRRKAGSFTTGILEDLLFIAVHGHIDGIDDADIRLLPGIYRPAHDLQFAHLGSRNFQQLRRFIRKLRHIVLRGH